MIDGVKGAAARDLSSLHGVPNLPGGFLSRPRLLAALDAATQLPLIVLRGPGGAGKSTLVADWLRRDDHPSESVVWLSLDAAAGSRVAFWNRLARALRHAGLADATAPLALAEIRSAEAEHIPGLLVSELGRPGVPIRLILDDLHHVPGDVADDLIWVLERCPRLLLVVTTRRRESFESGTAQVRLLGTTVLKPSELAFTSGESAELIGSAASGLGPVSGAIHAITGGNPLATRLAISVLDAEPFSSDPEVVAERVNAQTARYFLPVFSDTDRRDAALRLSVAPYVDRELARELTGRTDVDALLEEFEQDGIASTRLNGDSWQLRFHPLVARALEAERSRLESVELAGLRLTTADFLERAGDLLGAIQQLLDAERHDLVWPVITRNLPEFWNHYGAELETLLLRVPASVLRRHPTLAVALVVIRSHRESTPSPLTRGLADEAIDELERRLEHRSGEEGLLLLAAVLSAHRAARRFLEAAEAAGRLLELIDRLPASHARRAAASIDVVLAQIAQGAVLDGRIDDALSAASRISGDADPVRLAHALSLSALIAALQGESTESRRLTSRLSALPLPAGWPGGGAAVGGLLAEAITRLDRYDAEGALAVIEEIDLAAALDLWPYPAWIRGFARLLGGEAERGAGELLGELSRSRHRYARSPAGASLTALTADLLLAAGRLTRARRTLAHHASSVHPPTAFALARIALAEGEPDRAHVLSSPHAWNEEATERHRIEAHLLTATAQARLGFLETGRQSALHALAIIDRTGSGLPLAMVHQSDLLELFEGSPEVADRIRSAPAVFADILNPTSLTRREQEVLNTLAATTGVEAISEQLFVSVNTVKTQLRSVYRKLGVTSRSEAVHVARLRGLIEG